MDSPHVRYRRRDETSVGRTMRVIHCSRMIIDPSNDFGLFALAQGFAIILCFGWTCDSESGMKDIQSFDFN